MGVTTNYWCANEGNPTLVYPAKVNRASLGRKMQNRGKYLREGIPAVSFEYVMNATLLCSDCPGKYAQFVVFAFKCHAVFKAIYNVVRDVVVKVCVKLLCV